MTTALPTFRRDLQLFAGPPESDGSPSFSFYDPVRSEYFKLSWVEATLLRLFRPGMTAEQLLVEIQQKSTLTLTAEDIQEFFLDAARQGLLVTAREGSSLFQEAKRQQVGWGSWFVWNYLYLRIPLFHPDGFLTRTFHLVKPLLSPFALTIYALLSVVGLFSLFQGWSSFFYTFPYFFNAQGILAYGLAVSGIKVLHEFSHAYTAKKYGVRVPTMGVALLVLLPVLYTDATDAWRLKERYKRIAISSAGMIAEFALAGVALIIWGTVQDGIIKSLCFVVASTSLFHTLLVNLNPAMRFDGYYILSDLLAVDNLFERSFQVWRWGIYRGLLGMDIPDPEPQMTMGRRIILLSYAIYSWIYRIFLYTAIALFVYYQFTKAIGIVLLIIEIWVFMILPTVIEVRFLMKEKRLFRFNAKLIVASILGTVLLGWFILPISHTLTFPAVVIPREQQAIFAPNSGIVTAVQGTRLLKVTTGQPLLEISPSPLNRQRDESKQEARILQARLSTIEATSHLSGIFLETRAKLLQAQAEEKTLQSKIQRNTLLAPLSGQLFYFDPLLHVGQAVSKNQLVGKVASSKRSILCYIPEQDLTYIQAGQAVTFLSRGTLKSYKGTLKQITPLRAKELSYTQLASIHHGELPVSLQNKQYLLTKSYYPALVELDEDESLLIGETGKIRAKGEPTSLALFSLEYLLSLILSQSGI